MTGHGDLQDLFQLSLQCFKEGTFAEAAQHFKEVAHYYENHSSEFGQAEKASLFNHYGLALKRSGNLIQAEKVYLQSNEWTDYQNPCYLNNLAVCYFEMGAYALSRHYYEKSIDILKILDNDSLSLALYQSNLGTLYTYKGAIQEAKHHLIQSLETFRHFNSQDDISHAQFRLGYLSYIMGYFSEAVKFLKTAVYAKASLYSRTHPRTAEIILVLAEVYMAQRDLRRAKSLTLNALSIFLRNMDPHAPQIGRCYLQLAEIESLKGVTSGDLKANLRKAYSIFKHSYPHWMNPDMASYHALRGKLLIYEKKYRKGLTYLNKALQIRQGLFETIHPALAMNYNDIGYCYVQLKQPSQARKAYLESLHIFKRIHRQHPWLPFLLRNIAELYHNNGIGKICLNCGLKISKESPSLLKDAHVETESRLDVLAANELSRLIRPEIDIVLIATADMEPIARQLQEKINAMVYYYDTDCPNLNLSTYIENASVDGDMTLAEIAKKDTDSPYFKTFICLAGEDYGYPAHLQAELLKKNPWMTNFRDRALWEILLRDCIQSHAAGTIYHVRKRVSGMDIQHPYLRIQALIHAFQNRKRNPQVEVKAISKTDLHAVDLIMYRLNLSVLQAKRQFNYEASKNSVQTR